MLGVLPDWVAGHGAAGADPSWGIAGFLERGGPAIWAIAVLSIATLALILWKLWRFLITGVWRRARAERALQAWREGDLHRAEAQAGRGRGYAARFVAHAIGTIRDPGLASLAEAREETGRVARGMLAEARSGLRALELIATIAPLIGLLGTVLGMISAFQELQASGSRADPSALAGGIWEALLTTAAGMAVAIPAAASLAFFESTVDRLRRDMEDMATRIFTRMPGNLRGAGRA